MKLERENDWQDSPFVIRRTKIGNARLTKGVA